MERSKGVQLYNMVELYKREAIKITNQLYELIHSSDVLLGLPINWRDTPMLGTPIFELLWDFFQDLM